MADNYVMLDGTRYTIEGVEDRDTMFDDGERCYGVLTLAISYPIEED